MSAEAVFPRGTLPRAAQRARADGSRAPGLGTYVGTAPHLKMRPTTQGGSRGSSDRFGGVPRQLSLQPLPRHVPCGFRRHRVVGRPLLARKPVLRVWIDDDPVFRLERLEARANRRDVGWWNGRVTTAEEEQDRSRDAIRFRERRPHGEARSLVDDAAAVETDERAGIRMAGGDERG